jgi:CRP-like cAMP-binding protein
MAAPTKEELANREAEIQQLVEQDQRQKAGEILFELIADCAKGGDIKNANRLRDLLYDVDPMALSSVIKASEIIDEAMSGAVNAEFNLLWSGLKSSFSEEEFLSLYHSLEEHQVEEKKVVVKAGAKLGAVFFITKGNVKVICRCNNKNCAVTTLEPGTMIADNFFQPSVWTVSLLTISPTTLFILREKQLDELENKHPGFETKLAACYQQFDNVSQKLQEQNLHRRHSPRLPADHKISFQALAPDGSLDERCYRSELDNVSNGGLAFLLRIVNRDNRRMLFGRRLQFTIPLKHEKIILTGTVVAVTMNDLQTRDYSIHLSFDQPISNKSVQVLLPTTAEKGELAMDFIDDDSLLEEPRTDEKPDEKQPEES